MAAATAAASPSGSGSGPSEWPILGRAKIVYADAGLVAAASMGPFDPFYNAAMRFFRAAEQAGVTVLVSYLTILEVVDVARKRAKMRLKCRDEGEGGQKEADAAAAAAVDGVVGFLDTWGTRRVVVILKGKAYKALDFEHMLAKMLDHKGRTPSARKGATYRHDAIGPIDMIHIMLAYLAGAQAICTTDRALAQIKDDPLYGGMEVITLLPRPAPAKIR